MSAYHVENIVQSTDPLTLHRVKARNTEDCRRIDSHTSNTNPFLHNLQPNNQLHSPTDVQVTRLPAKQHREVRVPVDNSLLHLGNALDILELGFGADPIFWAAATQTLQNVSCFLLAADLDQPTGGLGEEPDGDEENQKEDDLEGDGETPAEGGFTAVDEGEAAIKREMLDLF